MKIDNFTTIEDTDDYGPLYHEVCLACESSIEFWHESQQEEFRENHKDCKVQINKEITSENR